jgi:acyl carrier protein
MTDANIYAELTELFHDLFGDNSIILTPMTSADDIDRWDSFNHLNLIAAVEERFRIGLTTREIGSLTNVGDMVKLIRTKQNP